MNNNLKNVLVSVTVAIIVVVIGFVVGGKSQPQITLSDEQLKELKNSIQLGSGSRFPSGIAVGTSTAPNLGEFSLDSSATTTAGGPDKWTYIKRGGVEMAYNRVKATATSSIPVRVQSPWFGTASSSPENISCTITKGILGDNSFDISTSSGSYGSSTPALLWNYTVSSNRLASFGYRAGDVSTTTAPTTPTVNTGNVVFSTFNDANIGNSTLVAGPNDWYVARIATSSPGTFAGGYYDGHCDFEIRKL